MNVVKIWHTKNLIILLILILGLSFIILYPTNPIFSQNESNRVTPPEGTTSESEIGQPETMTTTAGPEEKIRCSNGSLVDQASECTSSDECPSEPSENVILQCIQQLPTRGSNNTNATNASSINEVKNAIQIQNEDASTRDND